MMDVAAVAERLRLPERYLPWLAEVAEPQSPVAAGASVVPVGRDRAAAALAPLGLAEADRAEVLAHWPGVDWPPQRWWLLERLCGRAVADIGSSQWRPWPGLGEVDDPATRLVCLYAFVAAVPALRRWHRGHGIPEEVTGATLADVGRHVAKTRAMLGRVGLDTAAWVGLGMRGGMVELGRLQYEPVTLGASGARSWYGSVAEVAADLRSGRPALNVHIPETGALAEGEVASSLSRARGFFAEHFGVDYPVAVCASWLLDEQLGAYLAPESNIMAFQRRFEPVEGAAEGDSDVFRFVFNRPEVVVEEVAQDSRLQRAIVTHLRGGGHWRVRTGWLRLN